MFVIYSLKSYLAIGFTYATLSFCSPVKLQFSIHVVESPTNNGFFRVSTDIWEGKKQVFINLSISVSVSDASFLDFKCVDSNICLWVIYTLYYSMLRLFVMWPALSASVCQQKDLKNEKWKRIAKDISLYLYTGLLLSSYINRGQLFKWLGSRTLWLMDVD